MANIEVGSIRRFGHYRHLLEGVPEVFWHGAPLVIVAIEPDGVLQCALADYDGRAVHQITDTLFAEELAEA